MLKPHWFLLAAIADAKATLVVVRARRNIDLFLSSSSDRFSSHSGDGLVFVPASPNIVPFLQAAITDVSHATVVMVWWSFPLDIISTCFFNHR